MQHTFVFRCRDSTHTVIVPITSEYVRFAERRYVFRASSLQCSDVKEAIARARHSAHKLRNNLAALHERSDVFDRAAIDTLLSK